MGDGGSRGFNQYVGDMEMSAYMFQRRFTSVSEEEEEEEEEEDEEEEEK